MTKTTGTCFMADSTLDFECAMGNCEDSCCRNTGWNIRIDAETYAKYKEIGGETGQHILDAIEVEKSPETGTNYKLKIFEHGHCPLLTPEGMCLIHRDLGPEYLCHTCMSYPQVYTSFNDAADHWLSLSCPEAVRHTLFRNKRITFAEIPVNFRLQISAAKPFESERDKLRRFLIEVAQQGNISVKEKLTYMGMFLRSASRFPLDRNFGITIDGAINMYRDNILKKGSLDSLMKDMGAMHPDNRKEFFKVLTTVASACAIPPRKLPEGIENTQYYDQMAEFYNDVKSEAANDYLVDTFDRLIVPYVNANSHIFENYLSYSVLSTQFINDVAKSEDFSAAFAGFAGEFLAMLAFTAGLFRNNETLTDDDLVIAIYLYHRKISHNKKLREHLSQAFTDDIFNFMLGALGGIK